MCILRHCIWIRLGGLFMLWPLLLEVLLLTDTTAPIIFPDHVTCSCLCTKKIYSFKLFLTFLLFPCRKQRLFNHCFGLLLLVIFTYQYLPLLTSDVPNMGFTYSSYLFVSSSSEVWCAQSLEYDWKMLCESL